MPPQESISNSSPVYEAVKNTVSLFDLDDQACVFSYKDKKHFQGLWDLLDSSPEQSDELSRTFIIVWDGIPPRSTDVVTDKYLTPIDWAVGFSLSVKNKLGDDKKQQYPDIRIIILDTGSASKDSDGIKYVNQLHNRDIKNMPWLRIIASVGGDSGRKLDDFLPTVLNATDNDNMPTMKEACAINPDLDIIRNIWAAFLTRPSTPGDHHALANLVGPLLLIKDNDIDLHVKALSKLMRAIGLLPKGKETDSLLTAEKSWINWQESERNGKWDSLLKSDGTTLNLVMVDDMCFKADWGKMLCWAVGAEYTYKGSGDSTDKGPIQIGRKDDKIIIKAASSVKWLLGKLEKIRANKDQRFNFALDDNESHLEILFLDLRLFPGKETAEAMYFKRLIEIAKTLKKGANDNLPWDGFEDEEIREVEQWLEDKNRKLEDDRYIAALTLLPRILALTDLSLPIVLFSSTGRRDIAEKLKPYGNIITVFDKPKFTVDIPIDIAKQTRTKFVTAIGKALGCLIVRKGMNERIQKCKDVVTPLQENPTSELFASLFIDESGDGNVNTPLVMGGIVAVANSRKELEDFERYLQSNKPNWTMTGGLPKYYPIDDPSEAMRAMQNYTDNGEIIFQSATNNDVKLYGVALCQSPSVGVIPPDILLDDCVLDNLHRNMLRTLIELVVSYITPIIAGDKILHLSVVVSARSVPVSILEKQEPDIVAQLLNRFGMRAKDLSKGGRLLDLASLLAQYESYLPTIYELQTSRSTSPSEESNFKRILVSDLIRNLQETNSDLIPKGQSFYVLDEKDVYPIVSSVLEEYRYSNLKIESEVAKAVIVPNAQTLASKYVSQLIYFADWLPRMVYHSRIKNDWLKISWVTQLTSDCRYIGIHNSLMERLLRTRRLLMEGAESEAVRSFLDTPIEDQPTDFPDTLNLLLMTDICDTMRTLPGEAFLDSFADSEKFIQVSHQCPNREEFIVQSIDPRTGVVLLKNTNTYQEHSSNLECWNSLPEVNLPPLIGDKVSGVVSRSRGGDYRVVNINPTLPLDSKWRFNSENLEGVVSKVEERYFLIVGNSALGESLIICQRQNGQELKQGDRVRFKLIKGYRSKNLRSPWSLVAADVQKINDQNLKA